MPTADDPDDDTDIDTDIDPDIDPDIDLDRADGVPDDPADPVPAAARDRTRMAIRLVVLLVILVGAVLGAVAITRHHQGGTAAGVRVGDCVRATADKAVRVLDCADPAAEYVVVGRVEDQTEKDASMDACAPFQDKGVTQVYWEGTAAGADAKGMVLCLAPNTRGR